MASPFDSGEYDTLSDWIDTILEAHKAGTVATDQARADLFQAVDWAMVDVPRLKSHIQQDPLAKWKQFNA